MFSLMNEFQELAEMKVRSIALKLRAHLIVFADRSPPV